MPVTIKKHTNVWFVKATGAYLKTDKKTDSKMFGISLGLYINLPHPTKTNQIIYTNHDENCQ